MIMMTGDYYFVTSLPNIAVLVRTARMHFFARSPCVRKHSHGGISISLERAAAHSTTVASPAPAEFLYTAKNLIFF